MFEDNRTFIIKPILCWMIFAHIASSCVNILQPNFSMRALFIASALFNPILPFSLANSAHPSHVDLFSSYPLTPPSAHLLTYLSNSLWNLNRSPWICIWKILMLLSTDLARVTRPAMDKHFVFHPSRPPRTFYSSMIFTLPLRPRYWMWCPKKQPNFLVLGTPIFVLNHNATCSKKFEEKKIEDLLKLTFWHDVLQKLLSPSWCIRSDHPLTPQSKGYHWSRISVTLWFPLFKLSVISTSFLHFAKNPLTLSLHAQHEGV